MDADLRIAPRELFAQIKAGTAPAILDVRSEAEYAASHVPGARHVPFWAVPFRARRMAPPRGPLVVYCGHGPRAALAKAALRMAGFTRLLDLDGHMDAWLRAKLPVESGPPARRGRETTKPGATSHRAGKRPAP